MWHTSLHKDGFDMASDPKRAGKTEVLSMRMDPKTRFLLDVLTRQRGQSISTVVERAVLEAADNAGFGHEGKTNWRDLWHVNEGIRFLRMWGERELFPSYEDEYKLDFARTHWPFFYASTSYRTFKEWSIEIIWPRLDEFLDIWTKTKSTDYFAAGKAMQRAISDAGVKAPDWPPKSEPTLSKTEKPNATSGVPLWDAPKGGDLDDEIPF